MFDNMCQYSVWEFYFVWILCMCILCGYFVENFLLWHFLACTLTVLLTLIYSNSKVQSSTLLCGIIMQHILLIFDFFSCLHGLLGTARLFILLKNSYLHVYLEQKSFHFRLKTVNFSRFYLRKTTIRRIDMPICFSKLFTSIFYLLVA